MAEDKANSGKNKESELRVTFAHYADPEKARRVWAGYCGDIIERGLEDDAFRILNSCRRSDDLDVYLDGLVSTKRRTGSGRWVSVRDDPDPTESWGRQAKYKNHKS